MIWSTMKEKVNNFKKAKEKHVTVDKRIIHNFFVSKSSLSIFLFGF